jgi:hypothetical protein
MSPRTGALLGDQKLKEFDAIRDLLRCNAPEIFQQIDGGSGALEGCGDRKQVRPSVERIGYSRQKEFGCSVYP